MRLFLCRHGIAEDPAGKVNDDLRALTDEGIRKMRKIARGFVRLAGKKAAARILMSPLIRAKQTALILAEIIEDKGGRVELLETPALAPATAGLPALLQAVREAVREEGGGESVGVIAVGHEPLLSEWIAELCLGRSKKNRREGVGIQMKKGAIAAIDLHDSAPAGTLAWLLQPRELRRVK